MLTGRPPFGEGTIHERLLKHQTQEPPSIADRRPGVPQDLIKICRKMMAKDPADRYQTAEEVARVLADWRPPAKPKLKRAVPLEERPEQTVEDVAELAYSATARKQPTTRRRQARGFALPMDKLRRLLSDRRMIWIGGVAGTLLGLLLAFSLWALLRKPSKPQTEAVASAQLAAAKTGEAKGTKTGKELETAEAAVESSAPEHAKPGPESPKDSPQAQPVHKQPAQQTKPDGKQDQAGEKGQEKPKEQTPSSPPEKKEVNKPAGEPKPKADAKEPPPAPPKPQPKPVPPPDPLKDFPNRIELPELSAEEAKQLATILTSADVPWQLELFDGENVLRGNRQLVMEAKEENGKATWVVQLSAAMPGKDPTLTEIARFWRQGEALWFQWAERPPIAANQLRLCRLKVTAGGKDRVVPLFQPVRLEPIVLDLDRGSGLSPTRLAWLPDSSKIHLQVTGVEGLKDYVIAPTDPFPLVGPKPVRPTITFTRKDPRTKTEQNTMVLTLSFKATSSTLTADARLPDLKSMGPAFSQFKSWSAFFKSLSGPGMREMAEDQFTRADRRLEKPEKLPPQERESLRLTSEIWGTKLWYIDFYRMANRTAKIHFKLFAKLGEQMLEVGTTAAGAGPGK